MDILEQLKAGVVTGSAEETERIGESLAKALPENSVLALSGELGTGKTTLVRGLARGMGIQSDVTSPTYTIYTIYQGSRQLLHMDAYRLSNAHELDSLTLEEFLREPYIVAVEWPEHIPGFFEEFPCYQIDLSLLPDHRHQICLK